MIQRILMFLFILACLIGLISLMWRKSSNVEISVLSDITDSLLSKPQADDFISIYDFEGLGKWNAVSFRIAPISNVSYNRFSEIKLNAANEWLSNEFERKKQVESFQKNLTDQINKLDQESVGKSQSSVYMAIAGELNRISKSSGSTSSVYIYSDLMENSSDLSFYDPRILTQLQSHPAAIITTLRKMQPLPSLKGIQVYLIYQPGDSKQDEVFRIVSGFYKRLLEEKGAIVSISANI